MQMMSRSGLGLVLSVLLSACGPVGSENVAEEAPWEDLAARRTPGERAAWRIETPQGPRLVTYEWVGGMAVAEGDIVLGPANGPDMPNGAARSVGRWRWDRVWHDGHVPFEIAADFSATQRAQVSEALTHWNANTPYHFFPRNAHADYIRFVTAPSGPCYSYVGRQGGRQDITLGPNCGTGSIIHEIGHAMGFWHEQSRADRDRFVTIQWDNVIPEQRHNFQTYTEQNQDGADLFDYDYGSIMHYDATAFSQNNLPTIVRVDGLPLVTQRARLSDGDIAGAVRMLTRWQSALLSSGFPFPRFPFRLRPASASGLCLDVANASRARNAAVNQYTCNGQANQRWYAWRVPGSTRYLLINDGSGQCLDIPDGASASGVRLQQYPCHGFASQQFERVPAGRAFALRNVASGLCLDVPDGSGASGVRLQQYLCHGGPNQQFFDN